MDLLFSRIDIINMELPESVQTAVRRYELQKEIARKYYHDHKDEILQKKKDKYRSKNPNPKPVGRPRKVLIQATE